MTMARYRPSAGMPGYASGRSQCAHCGDEHLCAGSLASKGFYGGYDDFNRIKDWYKDLDRDLLGNYSYGGRPEVMKCCYGGPKSPEYLWSRIRGRYSHVMVSPVLSSKLATYPLLLPFCGSSSETDLIQRNARIRHKFGGAFDMINRFMSYEWPSGYNPEKVDDVRRTLERVAIELQRESNRNVNEWEEYQDLADQIFEFRQVLDSKSGPRHLLGSDKKRFRLHDYDYYDEFSPLSGGLYSLNVNCMPHRRDPLAMDAARF